MALSNLSPGKGPVINYVTISHKYLLIIFTQIGTWDVKVDTSGHLSCTFKAQFTLLLKRNLQMFFSS